MGLPGLRKEIEKKGLWCSHCGSVVYEPTSTHEDVDSIPSLCGLRIWLCCVQWCTLETRLGSLVAVAVAWAGSCSSDLTPSLGTSICCQCGPKKKKKKKAKKCLLMYFQKPRLYKAQMGKGMINPHNEEQNKLHAVSLNTMSVVSPYNRVGAPKSH